MCADFSFFRPSVHCPPLFPAPLFPAHLSVRLYAPLTLSRFLLLAAADKLGSAMSSSIKRTNSSASFTESLDNTANNKFFSDN